MSRAEAQDIGSLEIEVRLLEGQLEASEEELRILTNTMVNTANQRALREMEAAREREYPQRERFNDLKTTKAALERAIRATRAQTKAFRDSVFQDSAPR